MIDLLIRNQTIVLLLIAGCLSLSVATPHDIERVLETAPRPFRAVLRFVAKYRYSLGVAAVILLIVATVAALTDWTPVPKTFGLTLPPITPAPHQLPKKKLLIFIHGWNGDAAGTWKRFPEYARLDPRLGDFDIWSIDYPTYITKREVGISRLAYFFGDQFETVYGIYGRVSPNNNRRAQYGWANFAQTADSASDRRS